jgi:hypothetical protein
MSGCSHLSGTSSCTGKYAEAEEHFQMLETSVYMILLLTHYQMSGNQDKVSQPKWGRHGAGQFI